MKAILLVMVLLARVAEGAYRSHLVMMVIRHGARATGDVNDAFRSIGVSYPKQLTTIGKLQHEQLGRRVRGQYFPLSPNKEIQVSSSPSIRCVESMRHFAAGFGLHPSKEADFEVLPKTFFNQRKLGKFTDAQLEAFDKKFERLINRLIEKAKGHGWDEVRQHYCPKCVDSGSPSALARSLKKLSTIVSCHKGNEIETIQINPRLHRLLDKGFRLHYTYLAFQSETDARVYSRDALRVVAKSLLIHLRGVGHRDKWVMRRLRVLGATPHKAESTTIMFAHDGNILAFLRLFEKPSQILKQEIYRPPFASHIKFEVLHGFRSPEEYHRYYRALFADLNERPLPNDLYIRIKYQDRPLKIRQCDYRTCTLRQFVGFLERKIK